MCPYLSLSCCNLHTVITSNHRTPWSRRRFSCRPTPVSTLSISCCSCTWSNIFILFFVFVPPPNCAAVCSVGCGSFSSRGGGEVIATWTGREGGDYVAFIFLFVCAVPSVVLVLLCPWSWRRVRFPRLSLTSSMGDPAVAVPTVANWSSLDWKFPPILPSPSLSFGLRGVHCGEYPQYFTDRLRGVAVIVSVFRYNLASIPTMEIGRAS